MHFDDISRRLCECIKCILMTFRDVYESGIQCILMTLRDVYEGGIQCILMTFRDVFSGAG